jgi:hypothetical protein
MNEWMDEWMDEWFVGAAAATTTRPIGPTLS